MSTFSNHTSFLVSFGVLWRVSFFFSLLSFLVHFLNTTIRATIISGRLVLYIILFCQFLMFLAKSLLFIFFFRIRVIVYKLKRSKEHIKGSSSLIQLLRFLIIFLLIIAALSSLLTFNLITRRIFLFFLFYKLRFKFLEHSVS